jgi:hypothetical protein
LSAKHIDVLVTAAVSHDDFRYGRGQRVTYENVTQIGEMLRDQNIKSVDARYDDDPSMLPAWTAEPYHWDSVPVSPLQAFKAIHCYAYQACEDSAWGQSDAKQFCDALERALVRSLPGYDEAAWALV